MKVILIRSRATDPNIFKLARTLANNGFNVSLLIWDRLKNNKNERITSIIVDYVKIHAPYDSLSVIIYLPFWWLYEFIFLLKNSDGHSIIHACDLDTLLPALMVRFIKKNVLNYTIYDFYADNLPEMIPKKIRYFIGFIEKFCIRFTQNLILVDESRLEQINGAKYNKLLIINNTPEDYIKNIDFHSHHNLKDFVIFYAGILHETRGLLEILNVVNNLENVKFIIAGEGPLSTTIGDKEHGNYKNIEYIGWIPYDEVIMNTMKSDLLFAFYDPRIPNNRYASPNKLFEAMMCGKPIIVNDGTSMADIVRRENCGIVVPYGNYHAIRDAIIKLKNDPDLCKKLGENGRRAYEEKYNWKIMEERILTAYSQLS